MSTSARDPQSIAEAVREVTGERDVHPMLRHAPPTRTAIVERVTWHGESALREIDAGIAALRRIGSHLSADTLSRQRDRLAQVLREIKAVGA